MAFPMERGRGQDRPNRRDEIQVLPEVCGPRFRGGWSLAIAVWAYTVARGTRNTVQTIVSG